MSEDVVGHTPGPWESEIEDDGESIIVGVDLGDTCYGFSIAVVNTGDPDMTKADARLIVAAPDLLAACESALEQAEGCWQHHYGDNPEGGPTPRHIELLRAAIAKAKVQA